MIVTPHGEYPVIATTMGKVRHYKCLYDENEGLLSVNVAARKK